MASNLTCWVEQLQVPPVKFPLLAGKRSRVNSLWFSSLAEDLELQRVRRVFLTPGFYLRRVEFTM